MEDELLTGVEAAEYLGVTSQYIYKLRREGKLGQLIAGKVWLYPKSQLETFSKNRRSVGRPIGYKPPRKPREEKEG